MLCNWNVGSFTSINLRLDNTEICCRCFTERLVLTFFIQKNSCSNVWVSWQMLLYCMHYLFKRNLVAMFQLAHKCCYIACIIPHLKLFYLTRIMYFDAWRLLSYSLFNPVLQVIMVQKRSFDAEEILEGSFKHPKHAGPSTELFSLSESVFPDDDCHLHMPKTSGGCLVDGLSMFEQQLQNLK